MTAPRPEPRPGSPRVRTRRDGLRVLDYARPRPLVAVLRWTTSTPNEKRISDD